MLPGDNSLLVLTIKSRTPLGARRTWSDGARQRVETRLNNFIHWVLVIGESFRLEEEKWERWRREREEAETRHRLEAQRTYDLDSRLADWAKAAAIRDFATAVEKHALASTGPIAEGSALGLWLEWARMRAESLEARSIETLPTLRTPPPGYLQSW